MDAFSKCHPIVNFMYFTFVLLFSMIFMHPVCLLISLVSSFLYSVSLNGRKAIKFNLAFLLPMIIVTALLNPAFNHEGGTILTYLPNGNPLTLESIVYGIASAVMLASVVAWFSCYNKVMTSDKFIYLFGRVIPSMSLILSMVLRFVPKFKAQIKLVSNAQRCIGKDVSNGSIFERARHGITILSIMTTWALENAIETADSMKSRGYGLEKRTSFSIFKMTARDKKALFTICLLGSVIIIGSMFKGAFFRYYPTLKGSFNWISVCVFISYFILCAVPLIINKEEERAWNVTK